jgi:hypothetical protein
MLEANSGVMEMKQIKTSARRAVSVAALATATALLGAGVAGAAVVGERPVASSATAPSAADPVSGAVDPFVAHLKAAHFNRGVGGQVQDISELDDWSKTHEALVRQMLDYEVGPASALGTAPVTSVFMQHMDNAHWNRSPMGQASDIANFDSWNKSHLAMIRMMADPFVGKTSTLGTSPGTSVFMQHLDAAHWNQSVNGQVTAITDDLPAWTASHAAMAQMMAGSATEGSAPHGR